MFCPKCGTQNPDNGKFCRNCGTDLTPVSDALTEGLSKQSTGFGMMPPMAPMMPADFLGKKSAERRRRQDPNEVYGDAVRKIVSGIGFLIVAIGLLATGVAGGHAWWWAMLFPAFGLLSKGISDLAKSKRMERSLGAGMSGAINQPSSFGNLSGSSANLAEVENLLRQGNKTAAIKVFRELTGASLKNAKESVERIESRQTATPDFVAPPRGSIYETGELNAPPSVTENTTRHLEIDSEGNTMTLPKNPKL